MKTAQELANSITSSIKILDLYLEDDQGLRSIIDEEAYSDEELHAIHSEDLAEYHVILRDAFDIIQDFIEKSSDFVEEDFVALYSKIDENDDNTAIYIDFVSRCRKKFGFKRGSVNIWHIEQNDMKNDYNGRFSIKALCYAAFCEMQSGSDVL